MAWTSMHFAVGMASSGAVVGVGCYWFKRGWRWLPAAMTLGGIWALVPDLPRIFREDFPSLPFAATLGDRQLERWLHSIGDLFFFHRSLDAQPLEYALHGLGIILILYNLAIALLMVMEHRQRHSWGNRAWRARKAHRAGRHNARHRTGSPHPIIEADEEAGPVIARFRSSHLHRSA